MSFQDLEAGILRPQLSDPKESQQPQKPPHHQDDPSQAVAARIFQLRTAVSSFDRLVKSLGSHKDTLLLRDKLQKTRQHIAELVKETSTKLKVACEADHDLDVNPLRKIADAKLAKDLEVVLKDFQKAQRLAAERETAYPPKDNHLLRIKTNTSHILPTEEMGASSIRSEEQHLMDSKRQDIVLLENEITFNEAIIEEREQGIREIQEQIGEVNEIFKDLVVLVNEQGAMIDDVASNIEGSHAVSKEATNQLLKASKTQRANSSMNCLLLLIFGVALLIVVVVVSA